MGGGSENSCKLKVRNSDLCNENTYVSEECPWIYTKYKVENCKGIRLLTTVQKGPNKGLKYLRCQFDTCPSFQWLVEAKSEAKGEAKGHVGSSSNSLRPCSTSCFVCALDGHWANSCPWKESLCPRAGCTGVRVVRTSTTKTSCGKKFLTCSFCNKFHWLDDWIEKVGIAKKDSKSESIENSLDPQLKSALEAFL